MLTGPAYSLPLTAAHFNRHLSGSLPASRHEIIRRDDSNIPTTRPDSPTLCCSGKTKTIGCGCHLFRVPIEPLDSLPLSIFFNLFPSLKTI